MTLGIGRLSLVFAEPEVPGAVRRRPELGRLLAELRKDAALVVTRVDRLARSTTELLRIAKAL